MIVDLPVKTPVAAAQPVILCDTREQAPLIFTNLASQQATLPTADYSILGAEELFGIERKSIPDLVACCIGDNRARFERELHRLRGYRFKRLLIVGSEKDIREHRYISSKRSNADKRPAGTFVTALAGQNCNSSICRISGC